MELHQSGVVEPTPEFLRLVRLSAPCITTVELERVHCVGYILSCTLSERPRNVDRRTW